MTSCSAILIWCCSSENAGFSLDFHWTKLRNSTNKCMTPWKKVFFFLPACHSTLHSEVPTWKAGWDKLREWHWHLSVTMCQTDRAGTLSSGLCDDLEGRGGVGGRLQRKRVYVQLSLIHSVAQQKIQHCKAIILQLKKKTNPTQHQWPSFWQFEILLHAKIYF